MKNKTLIRLLLASAMLSLFSLNAFSARESDGEQGENWKVGDPYHIMRVEVPGPNGEEFQQPIFDMIMVQTEPKSSSKKLTLCKKKGKNVSADLYFVGPAEYGEHRNIFVKIGDAKIKFYSYDNSGDYGCLNYFGEMFVDEWVQQIENETLMMIDRLQLYFEVRSYFFDNIELVGDSKRWIHLYGEFRAFTSSVVLDLGVIEMQGVPNYGYRTGVERMMKIVNLSPIFSNVKELIENELADYDISIFTKYDGLPDTYSATIAFAREVMIEKFELGRVKTLKRMIRRYPSGHPRRIELEEELQNIYYTHGYTSEAFTKKVLDSWDNQ